MPRDDERTIEKRTRITHRPGIAKPTAAWDDLIQFTEMTSDTNHPTALQVTEFRSASVGVTAEFMRDAVDPLETVGQILNDQAT